MNHGDCVDVFYEIEENMFSTEDLSSPILNYAGPEFLEESFDREVPHAVTSGYNIDGRKGIQFRYRKEDWIPATEDIGDAITAFEKEVGLDYHSGL